jgi:hypothetical protein
MSASNPETPMSLYEQVNAEYLRKRDNGEVKNNAAGDAEKVLIKGMDELSMAEFHRNQLVDSAKNMLDQQLPVDVTLDSYEAGHQAGAMQSGLGYQAEELLGFTPKLPLKEKFLDGVSAFINAPLDPKKRDRLYQEFNDEQNSAERSINRQSELEQKLSARAESVLRLSGDISSIYQVFLRARGEDVHINRDGRDRIERVEYRSAVDGSLTEAGNTRLEQLVAKVLENPMATATTAKNILKTIKTLVGLEVESSALSSLAANIGGNTRETFIGNLIALEVTAKISTEAFVEFALKSGISQFELAKKYNLKVDDKYFTDPNRGGSDSAEIRMASLIAAIKDSKETATQAAEALE